MAVESRGSTNWLHRLKEKNSYMILVTARFVDVFALYVQVLNFSPSQCSYYFAGSKNGHITLLIIQTLLANKVECAGAIVLKLH